MTNNTQTPKDRVRSAVERFDRLDAANMEWNRLVKTGRVSDLEQRKACDERHEARARLFDDTETIQTALALLDAYIAEGEGELLPCPFCGGEASCDLETICDFHTLEDEVGWVVECMNCEAERRYADTKEEAIKAWNTRTTPDIVKRFIEEI